MVVSKLTKSTGINQEGPVPEFSITTVFEDPSSGRISGGFLQGLVGILMETEIENRFKQEAFDILIVIGMKMASLWNLRASYLQSLERAKQELKFSHENQHFHKHNLHSTELMGWTDVFLVQIKSTLDHLVKVPSPVLGANRWNLHTFGERGAKVKKALDNLPKQDKEKLADCYESIFGSQQWIDDTIEMRDKLNHGIRGGGDPRNFRVSYDANLGKFEVPMWNDAQDLSEALEIIFDNLLITCSIFCATIFEVRISPDKVVVCDMNIRQGVKPICKIEDKIVFAMKDQLRTSGVQVPD